MPEVERGTRSAHDAQAWTCVCGAVNEPKECLIFDIPKFKCQCGKEFDGDFDFCLADVRVNGQLLLENVLHQDNDACLPTAICQALRIMHVVDSICKNQYTDLKKMTVEPKFLINRYNEKFRSTAAVPLNLKSVHKFIHMSLILRDEGIPTKRGEAYKIGDVCSIPGEDFEGICEELAQGNPLVTNFHPGPYFYGLKYCQVYKAPLLTHVLHEVHNGEKVDSHMIVLIGAFSKGGVRGFYFLNSWGIRFCARTITENPLSTPVSAVSGGIGKIHEKSIIWNAMKFLHEGEIAPDGFLRLGEETDPDDVSFANVILCCDYLATKLVAIESDEVAAIQQAHEHGQEQEDPEQEQEQENPPLAQEQEDQLQLLAQQEEGQQQHQEQLMDWQLYLT